MTSSAPHLNTWFRYTNSFSHTFIITDNFSIYECPGPPFSLLPTYWKNHLQLSLSFKYSLYQLLHFLSFSDLISWSVYYSQTTANFLRQLALSLPSCLTAEPQSQVKPTNLEKTQCHQSQWFSFKCLITHLKPQLNSVCWSDFVALESSPSYYYT